MKGHWALWVLDPKPPPNQKLTPNQTQKLHKD